MPTLLQLTWHWEHTEIVIDCLTWGRIGPTPQRLAGVARVWQPRGPQPLVRFPRPVSPAMARAVLALLDEAPWDDDPLPAA